MDTYFSNYIYTFPEIMCSFNYMMNLYLSICTNIRHEYIQLYMYLYLVYLPIYE